MEICVALWQPEDLRALDLPDLCGCDWVQLNVDDDDVADAQLRLSTFEEPIRAIVTLPEGADWNALAPYASRLEAWTVESAAPLPPHETASGQRLDALANIAMLRVPEGLAYDDWLRIWRDDHTTVAIQTQATFGYVQRRVVEGLTPDAPDIAAIVEEHFPMAALTDFHAFYGSDGDDDELARRMGVMMESVGRFGAAVNLELVPTSRYVFRREG